MAKVSLCQICHNSAFKYKCPKCLLRYCSLPCYKNHKQENCANIIPDDVISNSLNIPQVDNSQVSETFVLDTSNQIPFQLNSTSATSASLKLLNSYASDNESDNDLDNYNKDGNSIYYNRNNDIKDNSYNNNDDNGNEVENIDVSIFKLNSPSKKVKLFNGDLSNEVAPMLPSLNMDNIKECEQFLETMPKLSTVNISNKENYMLPGSDESSDCVPSEILTRLSQSEKMLNMLKDAELRDMLKIVDRSNDPASKVANFMKSQIFENFATECLQIVEM